MSNATISGVTAAAAVAAPAGTIAGTANLASPAAVVSVTAITTTSFRPPPAPTTATVPVFNNLDGTDQPTMTGGGWSVQSSSGGSNQNLVTGPTRIPGQLGPTGTGRATTTKKASK